MKIEISSLRFFSSILDRYLQWKEAKVVFNLTAFQSLKDLHSLPCAEYSMIGKIFYNVSEAFLK